MVKVNFKNVEKSDLAKSIVLERIHDAVNKFPELSTHRISVCLEKNNSPAQPGPDEFSVSLHIKGKTFDDLLIEKKAATMYLAIAGVKESLLELLNRRTDKNRIKARAASRKLKRWSQIGSDKESA